MSRIDDKAANLNSVTLPDGRHAPIDVVLSETRRLRAREIRGTTLAALQCIIKRTFIAVFGPMPGWHRYQLPEELRLALTSRRPLLRTEPQSDIGTELNRAMRVREDDVASLKSDEALGHHATEGAVKPAGAKRPKRIQSHAA